MKCFTAFNDVTSVLDSSKDGFDSVKLESNFNFKYKDIDEVSSYIDQSVSSNNGFIIFVKVVN